MKIKSNLKKDKVSLKSNKKNIRSRDEDVEEDAPFDAEESEDESTVTSKLKYKSKNKKVDLFEDITDEAEDDESEDDSDDEDEDDDDELDDNDSDEESDEDEDSDDDDELNVKSTGKAKKEAVKSKGFLKRGKARKAMLESEDQKAEARQEAAGKTRRFFIPKDKFDEDIRITFLDGDLDDDGILDGPTFYEHNIKINNRWTQFVSCCDDEPDPLQEAGQEPYPAQAFTIVDHTGFVDREGKEWKNIKRLFIAKRTTQKKLQKLASKRKGLKGCTFDVSRSGDKEPNVGSNFEFVKKRSIKDLKLLLLKAGVKKDEVEALCTPANYEEELTHYTAKQIRKMVPHLLTKASTISSKKANEDAEDLDDEL